MDHDERTPKPTRKKSQKKIERFVEANAARRYQEQEQVLGLRPLILCGLPIRQREEPYYLRRSGPYLVEVCSPTRYGVPYGQDRLIPIFLSTLFAALGYPKDNRVSFLYARDILRLFDLPLDGPHYQRLHDGFARWQHTQIAIHLALEDQNGRKGKLLHSLCLMPKSLLWHQDPADDDFDSLPHEVWLAESWANEIRKHPVPVDLQSVRALTSCPGALDFYQWQTWRSYTILEETPVPLFSEGGLVHQLGCLEDQPNKAMRRLLERWQTQIRILWRECPNDFSPDGDAFLLRPGKALGPLKANRFLLSLIRGLKNP